MQQSNLDRIRQTAIALAASPLERTLLKALRWKYQANTGQLTRQCLAIGGLVISMYWPDSTVYGVLVISTVLSQCLAIDGLVQIS